MKRKPLNLKTRRGRITKALLDARIASGLTAIEAAKRMDVSISCFYEWE